MTSVSTPLLYDDIDRHVALAGGIDRAATPIGMYLAWCVNLSLVSEELLATADREVLRVKLREITGAELLIKGCHGRLSSEHLTPAGRDFTTRRYPEYLAEYARTFAVAPDEIYGVANTWDNYDRVAPRLTRWLLGDPPDRSHDAHERRRWWQRFLSPKR